MADKNTSTTGITGPTSTSTSTTKDARNLNKFQHFFYDYGRYHNNKINIFIHIIFVPIISATLFAITRYLSKVYLNTDFNVGTLIPLLTTPLYLYVDFFLGLFTSIEYLLLDHYMQYVSFGFDNYSDIKILVIIHLLAWLTQFIGHGAFEGRKPALMDNLLLTLSAPIFVNIEIFYFLFGYKKDQILEAKTYIVDDIKKYREKSKTY